MDLEDLLQLQRLLEVEEDHLLDQLEQDLDLDHHKEHHLQELHHHNLHHIL